ncbi:MAG: hypothetical protein JRM90_07375, partial [Nitrososphaerota archaeon]|nr:hypothetical protein [Nitrososphaerota archaeon]
MSKVRVGISFEPEVVGTLDEQVKMSPDLVLSRNEIANVIVKAFFEASTDPRRKTRELVVTNSDARGAPGR